MILKRYKNEIIVLFSIILLISGHLYKSAQSEASVENQRNTKYAAREFKELISLKKRWADKTMSKKVEKLKRYASPEKVNWKKKGKKLSVTYKNLTAKELNKVLTTILNLAIQIEKLKIKNNQTSYNLELKCKW
ncbi:hypothetical protein MNB_SV-5-288 [hydrothermal vent metagenome]|uniref:Uncharacterized protein n=1 Tax=hydrothermal vent metagenome TaxID=652676 RepID=A0A1W1EBE3_9ZZZZ